MLKVLKLLFLFFLSFTSLVPIKKDYSVSPYQEEKVAEEVLPIWNNGIIQSFEYTITISEETKDNFIIFSTHILDSIYHYKGINNTENISILLNIKSKDNEYYLDKIFLTNIPLNLFIENIPYQKQSQNNYLVYLSNTILKEDYTFTKIELKLKKKSF